MEEPMSRFVALAFALLIAACAAETRPVAYDPGREASENAGNAMGTASTWGGAIHGGR
jgi:hypothetical protein